MLNYPEGSYGFYEPGYYYFPDHARRMKQIQLQRQAAVEEERRRRRVMSEYIARKQRMSEEQRRKDLERRILHQEYFKKLEEEKRRKIESENQRRLRLNPIERHSKNSTSIEKEDDHTSEKKQNRNTDSKNQRNKNQKSDSEVRRIVVKTQSRKKAAVVAPASHEVETEVKTRKEGLMEKFDSPKNYRKLIEVEDASDDEDDLKSVWRNRVPSKGQWIEPVEGF